MVKPALRATAVVAVTFLWSFEPSTKAQSPSATAGVELTIRTPAAERFELALDEVELQWTTEGAARANAPAETPRTIAQRRTTGGVVFSVRAIPTVSELERALRELEGRNPDAKGHLVLYEADRPRTEASRRLLGREIAVILTTVANPTVVFKGLSPALVRPLQSVPRAYIVEAADPLSALTLADTLRSAPGVATAYPLLQRVQYAR
jgi:hypothetical protein